MKYFLCFDVYIVDINELVDKGEGGMGMGMEKKVYILLTDTGSFFTKLIKLFTKKRYNHASICIWYSKIEPPSHLKTEPLQ